MDDQAARRMIGGARLQRMVAGVAAWSRRQPLLAAFVFTFLASMLLAATIDPFLARSLKRDLDPGVFGFFKAITELGLGGPWFAVVIGAWLLCVVTAGLSLTTEAYERWRLHARSWFFALTNLIVAGTAVQAMKLLFGRYRPRYLFDDSLYGFSPFSGHNSYPSGHSQVIWSVAISLWFIYPRYRLFYVGAAFVISFSRVATTVHFVSDWMMGSVLAIVIGVWLHRRFEGAGQPPLDLARHRGHS